MICIYFLIFFLGSSNVDTVYPNLCYKRFLDLALCRNIREYEYKNFIYFNSDILNNLNKGI